MNTTTRLLAAAFAGLCLAPVAVACSDDEAAPATTTAAMTPAEYGERIDELCPGSDPGFDVFYSEHPQPTAADYAQFLPQPRAMVAELSVCITGSNPPAELSDEVAAVVDAMDVVVADLDAAIAAAEAGDLDETNRWLAQMHDIDQPKIDEAVAVVGEAIASAS